MMNGASTMEGYVPDVDATIVTRIPDAGGTIAGTGASSTTRRTLTAATADGDDVVAAIGAYADALLDTPLPWTKMRQVYALLGLVKRYGPERVEVACTRASEAEAYNVGLIGRMLERATEGRVEELPVQGRLISPRFARPAESFAVKGRKCPQVDTDPAGDNALEADTGGDCGAEVTDRAEGALA